MNKEILFPATIIVFKFLVKLYTDQEVHLLEFFKAFVVFPVDIAFLSMAFGAAVLTGVKTPGHPASVNGILVFAVLCGTAGLLATALSRKADRAFDDDNNGRCVVFGVCAYAVSIAALVASFSADKLA